MNKGANYSEKLEAYIRNELTEKEKLEFEELLRQDPLLQNELTLQRDIIYSIGEYRKNELKQRLNKIDVRGGNRSTPGDFSVGGAILGGIAIVGIAGLLVFNDSDNTTSTKQLTSSASQMTFPAGESLAVNGNVKDKEAFYADTQASELPLPETAVEEKKEEVTRPTTNTTSTAAKQNTTTSKKDTRSSTLPTVVEATPIQAQEEEIYKDDNLVMPESQVATVSEKADRPLIVVDNNSSSYKLHYKYTNDQLHLYGFDKPYKIIDLPQQTQRYLLYDGKFYKLNRNQPQIAPIQKVVNQQELLSLETYKEEKQ